MSPMLLQAVVRVADARTPDGELLERFKRNRDERAFEELVRRHGPLVWSVCRHLLTHHADAEDAFQAVFLALVRGAGAIRAAEALPGWLHGVAVRVSMRARRSAIRRRQREARAAVPEADRSVPDESWAALMTAVHEEIRQLPEAERTAFVLCDLEGVRQPDAAARLGWPLGTLSGRLCKARQRLLDQLTRRGISSAVLAIGGLAGTAGTVPATLIEQVTSFPTATAAGVSSTVASLARGLVEGATMRTKILAAAFLVAGAFSMSGGALVLSQADAQSGSGGGASASPLPDPNNPFRQPGAPPGKSGAGPTRGDPVGGGSGDGFFRGGGGDGAGSGTGGMTMMSTASPAWDYKFVDLKSDDRDAFTKAITDAGKDGWEFGGSERLRKGNEPQIVLVFKKPKGGNFQFGGGGMPGIGGGGRGGGGDGGMGGFGGFELPGLGGLGGGRLGGMSGFGSGGTVEATVHKLKSANADDVAKALEKAFPKAKTLKVVAEPSSNTIIVIADPTTAKDALKLIEELDAKKAPGGAGPRPPTGGGRDGGASGGARSPAGGLPPGGTSFSGGGSVGPMGMGLGGGFPAQRGGAISVIVLKHATAREMAEVVNRVFPAAEITPDARTNQLIVRSDEKTAEELKSLIQRLDIDVPKR